MKILNFTQITDSRFDENIKDLLQTRVKRLKKLLDLDGIELIVTDIKEVHFDGYKRMDENGNLVYEEKPSVQYRCDFFVRKNTSKITWDEIYDIVNSVNPVQYKFL